MRKLLNVFPVLALSVALAATLGLAGCGDNGTDPECDAGQNLCAGDGLCHECCVDDHCDQNEVCGDDYTCELDCEGEGADCASDPGICCDGLACDIIFSKECITACTVDDDCTGMAVDFAADLQCQTAGHCDWQHCSNDGNCRPGTVCYGGDCVSPADCASVASCKVVPGSAVTQDGTAVQMSATAFLTSGALAPGVSFEWASSDDTTASVAGGLVTGGATTGTATITATVGGCATTCDASVLNYGAVNAGDTRVVVVDELNGTPVEGINVEIHDGVTAPMATNASGEAVFAGVDLSATAADVSVHHPEYAYITMTGVNTADVIVHLGKLPDPSMAGGKKGSYDFDSIICEPNNPCEVKLGLGGMSIPGNLFNLNIDVLIGELILTHIELGGTSEDVPLPGGLVVGLNDTFFGDRNGEAWVTGVEGTRVLWALGGKLNLADLIEILGPVISGGEIDIGAILVAVLPLFNSFYTAMVPNLDITAVAKVADVNDINGNGETDDLVPDYGSFEMIGEIPLKVPMDQNLSISVGNLPGDGAGGFLYDGVIVLAGVLVRDAGLVPLGLSAGMDAPSAEDTPDGQIDNIALAVSDVAGRLPEEQVERVIVALALNIGKLTDPDNTDPLVIAGQVIFVDDFTGTEALNPFMGPAEYTYDPVTGALDITTLPGGIDYVQALGAGDTGTWQVMGPADATPINFTFPAVAGGDTRRDTLGLVAITLGSGIGFQDLIGFNGTNMNDLVKLVSEFVIVYGDAGGGLDISCSTSAGPSSLFGLFALLGLALLRRRR